MTLFDLKRNVEMSKKVTGIGGVFFKSLDPDKTKKWYQDNLGMKMDKYGALFEFRKVSDPSKSGFLQWGIFDSKSKYMDPSNTDFMINYRVHDLESLVEEFKQNGVEIVDEIEVYDYGKFIHIMDPDGRKIELWEPVDKVFDEGYSDNSIHD